MTCGNMKAEMEGHEQALRDIDEKLAQLNTPSAVERKLDRIIELLEGVIGDDENGRLVLYTS